MEKQMKHWYDGFVVQNWFDAASLVNLHLKIRAAELTVKTLAESDERRKKIANHKCCKSLEFE